MENQETIGARMRQLRLAAGLTHRQATKQIGASTQLICAWERGDSLPGARYLKIFREIYGADLNWLVCGEKQSDLKSKHSPAISIPNQISA